MSNRSAMSVYDVVAVDHLTSLQKHGDRKSATQHLRDHRRRHTSLKPGLSQAKSLPATPRISRKSSPDTLRKSMAKHQESLSRADSPFGSSTRLGPPSSYRPSSILGSFTSSNRHNHEIPSSSYQYSDDIPTSSYRQNDNIPRSSSYYQPTNKRFERKRFCSQREPTPFLDRSATSLNCSRDSSPTGAENGSVVPPSPSQSTAPQDVISHFSAVPPHGLYRSATLHPDRRSLHKSSKLTKSTKTAFGHSPLGSQEDNRRKTPFSSDENVDLISANYPYTGHTHTLPRNYRINSLVSPACESREALLGRYPSLNTSSRGTTPARSPSCVSPVSSSRAGTPLSSRGVTPLSSQGVTTTRSSRHASPFSSDISYRNSATNSARSSRKTSPINLESMVSSPIVSSVGSRLYNDRYTTTHSSFECSENSSREESNWTTPSRTISPTSSIRSSRRSSPTGSLRSSRRSSPVTSLRSSRKSSPATSLRSSRRVSPTNSVASSRRTSPLHPAISSRKTSPTNSVSSSRNVSPITQKIKMASRDSTTDSLRTVTLIRSSATNSVRSNQRAPTNSVISSRGTSPILPTNSVVSSRGTSPAPLDGSIKIYPEDTYSIRISPQDVSSSIRLSPDDKTSVIISPEDLSSIIRSPEDKFPIIISPEDISLFRRSSVDKSPVLISPEDTSSIRRSPEDESPDIISPTYISPIRRSLDDKSPVIIIPKDISPFRKSPVDKSPVIISPEDTSLIRKSPKNKSPDIISPECISPIRRSLEDKSPVIISREDTSPVRRSPVDNSPVIISPEDTFPIKRSSEGISPDIISSKYISPVRKALEDKSPVIISPEDTSPIRISSLVQPLERSNTQSPNIVKYSIRTISPVSLYPVKLSPTNSPGPLGSSKSSEGTSPVRLISAKSSRRTSPVRERIASPKSLDSSSRRASRRSSPVMLRSTKSSRRTSPVKERIKSPNSLNSSSRRTSPIKLHSSKSSRRTSPVNDKVTSPISPRFSQRTSPSGSTRSSRRTSPKHGFRKQSGASNGSCSPINSQSLRSSRRGSPVRPNKKAYPTVTRELAANSKIPRISSQFIDKLSKDVADELEETLSLTGSVSLLDTYKSVHSDSGIGEELVLSGDEKTVRKHNYDFATIDRNQLEKLLKSVTNKEGQSVQEGEGASSLLEISLVKESSPVMDEAPDLVRRQSVIIQGLVLETEELRDKVATLEDELACVPYIEELQEKLAAFEMKLDDSESYVYQLLEENIDMKTEMETLEIEINEAQDHFRDNDAREFKKTKWELETMSKSVRNLQLKLKKAQLKAALLRQEKEELEEKQKEAAMWRGAAVLGAVLVATFWRLKS